ncbi:carbon-nitrogen hydrolase family protein [Gudongella sp. SC589]|jgi:nitrilase|uniref:carbon-nitrogen hydrolase family protein n=1 Tax=Gudongella sp. SC589 TaxID=3385990 RepID=UPI003904B8DE
MEKKLTVSIIQDSPVIFDLEKTMEKTIELTRKAASKGSKLIVFPESFIPCYPRGLTFGMVVGSRTKEAREDYRRYYENSVAVPGPEIDQLAELTKELGVYLSIGVTEKNGEGLDGTLHCTNLFFGPDGYMGRHRKLKPTAAERVIWGEDDGSTITVLDTPYGKMGSLICWENYMPLARMAMYMKGVNLYIVPTADQREVYQATLRHIAFEGRCFVLMSNQYVERSMYPTDLKYYKDLEKEPEVMSRGGSCIINPYGEYVAGPLYDEPGILTAELDLDMIVESKLDWDPVGHYNRPEIFDLKINERP